MSFTGRRADGPSPAGFQVADQCAGGQNAVIAILAALFHRDHTGEGQYLDISMTDGAVHLGAVYAAAHLLSGEVPGREGTMLNGGGYYDYYATRDGEYLAIGGLEPQFFRAMLGAMGREDLMCKHMAFGADGDFLKNELKKEFSKRTRAEWEEIFRPVDACVEPVLTVAEAMKHPHLRARGMVVEVEKPNGKKLRQLAAPFKFSATPCEYNFVGPSPGAHTAFVLRQAGFSDAEIEELKSQKAVK
jgi:crotonobetainyl-CoA:carnitine CoA-transferase CaiB-like acyl-CoA transferase